MRVPAPRRLRGRAQQQIRERSVRMSYKMYINKPDNKADLMNVKSGAAPSAATIPEVFTLCKSYEIFLPGFFFAASLMSQELDCTLPPAPTLKTISMPSRPQSAY